MKKIVFILIAVLLLIFGGLLVRRYYEDIILDKKLYLGAAELEIERLEEEKEEMKREYEEKIRELRADSMDIQERYSNIVYEKAQKIAEDFVARFSMPPKIDTSEWEKHEHTNYEALIPSEYVETDLRDNSDADVPYVRRYWNYGDKAFDLFIEHFQNMSVSPEEFVMQGGGEYLPSPLQTTKMRNAPILIETDVVDGRRDYVWLPGEQENEWFELGIYYSRTEDWENVYLKEQEVFKAFVYNFVKK